MLVHRRPEFLQLPGWQQAVATGAALLWGSRRACSCRCWRGCPTAPSARVADQPGGPWTAPRAAHAPPRRPRRSWTPAQAMLVRVVEYMDRQSGRCRGAVLLLITIARPIDEFAPQSNSPRPTRERWEIDVLRRIEIPKPAGIGRPHPGSVNQKSGRMVHDASARRPSKDAADRRNSIPTDCHSAAGPAPDPPHRRDRTPQRTVRLDRSPTDSTPRTRSSTQLPRPRGDATNTPGGQEDAAPARPAHHEHRDTNSTRLTQINILIDLGYAALLCPERERKVHVGALSDCDAARKMKVLWPFEVALRGRLQTTSCCVG